MYIIIIIIIIIIISRRKKGGRQISNNDNRRAASMKGQMAQFNPPIGTRQKSSASSVRPTWIRLWSSKSESEGIGLGAALLPVCCR